MTAREVHQLLRKIQREVGVRPTPWDRKKGTAFKLIYYFCDEQGFEIELWIRSVYLRSKGKAVRLKALYDPSDESIADFKVWAGNKTAHAVSQQKLTTECPDDTPRDGTQLIVAWEKFKAVYEGDRNVCMMSQEMTGGYDPRSSWCTACDLKDECWQRVPEHVRRNRVGS